MPKDKAVDEELPKKGISKKVIPNMEMEDKKPDAKPKPDKIKAGNIN